MNPIVLQAFFAVFNFLLVAFLIYKFAGPKVAEGLKEKNEANRRAIEAADAALARATSELDSCRTRLANVDQELAAIVEQAKTMAVQTAQGITLAADSDASRLRAHAIQEINRERTIAQQAIHRAMLQQALEAAKEEMRRQMSPELQRQLVSRFIQNVGEGSCPINP